MECLIDFLDRQRDTTRRYCRYANHNHNLPTGFAHSGACAFIARVLLYLNAGIGTWFIAIDMLLERHYDNFLEAGYTSESSFLIREQCLFGFAIELVAIDTTAKIRNVDLLSGRIELQTYRFVKVFCQDLCSRA